MDLREHHDDERQRHPWERVRAEFFARQLRGLPAPRAILDVGAGDAYLAGVISRTTRARVVCWDPGYAQHETEALLAARDSALSFCTEQPTQRFEVITMLDVLEHVEDDLGFLRSVIGQNAAAGCHVLVSVPAWPRLYCERDRRLLHHRRYTPRALDSVLADAGLVPLRGGGLFHGPLLVRGAQVLGRPGVPGPRPGGGEVNGASQFRWRHGPALGRAAEALLRADSRISEIVVARGGKLPGLSEWRLCRTP